MLFKTKKSRTILQKIILYSFISFLGGAYVEQSMAGSSTSPYIKTLKDELINSLIKDNICKEKITCRKKIQMQGAGYSKIYLNMYEQTDTFLTSYVTDFLIKEGLKITNHTTITLSIYSKPLEDYM